MAALSQIQADVNAGGSYEVPWTPGAVTVAGHFGLPSAELIIDSRSAFDPGAAPDTFLGYLDGFFGWYGYGSYAFGDYYY